MNTQKRIKQLMEERGWTDYRLAKEANLSHSTVTNMFNRTEPLPAKAGRFSTLLKQPKVCLRKLLIYTSLLSDFKVIRIRFLLQILILYILFDNFICYVSATGHKISSRPQMLSPKLFI